MSFVTIYRVRFVDHAGNSFASQEVDCSDDRAAVTHARAIDRRVVGMGFDVWDGDRLVLRERRGPSA